MYVAKRYNWDADKDFLAENEHGALVLASDYDLLAHLYDAEVIALRAAGACYEKLKQENLTLHEKVSALESREVCAAAHENVETCGYCQRDNLAKALKRYASHDAECGYFKPCKCGLNDVLTVCGLSDKGEKNG